MKNVNSVMTLVLVALAACQLVSGQKPPKNSVTGTEKIITESDFYALSNKSEKQLHAQSYRTKKIEEIFDAATGALVETRTEVYESAPAADKMRVTEERKTASGGTSKTGFMMIGRERYEIAQSGKWILNPRSGWGSGIGSGGGQNTDTRVYKFIGKSKFQGKPVLVYEVAGKHRSYFNEQFADTDVTMRYLFSPDGKLLRQEGTNNYPSLNLRVKKLIVNEFNAPVNIQAPR